MTHASLFSGAGGFDLAAEYEGFTNLFACDIEPNAQAVLHHQFPNIKIFSDIRHANFKPYRYSVDVLSGGFPCQPFSKAGKQEGTQDERYLWAEMRRAIDEIRPLFVIGENVSDVYTAEGGLVLDEISSDLGRMGYSFQAFSIPASSVAAPQERMRAYFFAVAHPDRMRKSQPQRIDGKIFRRSCDYDRETAYPAPNGYKRGQWRRTKQRYFSNQKQNGTQIQPSTWAIQRWIGGDDKFSSQFATYIIAPRESRCNNVPKPKLNIRHFETHWVEVVCDLCGVYDGGSRKIGQRCQNPFQNRKNRAYGQCDCSTNC